MSGNLPFSHETVVHSLMLREAVALSQTIRNRICFMVKLNHTAYWRMAIQAQTNSSIPLKIWDHPLQCQHFVRYVSVAIIQCCCAVVSRWKLEPIDLAFAAKGTRCVASRQSMDARQSFWTITMMITYIRRHYWDSWAIMLRKETLKNGSKHKRTELTGLTSLRDGQVCTRRSGRQTARTSRIPQLQNV